MEKPAPSECPGDFSIFYSLVVITLTALMDLNLFWTFLHPFEFHSQIVHQTSTSSGNSRECRRVFCEGLFLLSRKVHFGLIYGKKLCNLVRLVVQVREHRRLKSVYPRSLVMICFKSILESPPSLLL